MVLLDTIGMDTIALVTLNNIPEDWQNVSLSQSRLHLEKGIMVMLVEHKGNKPEPTDPDTVFLVGDKLTVFGNYATIRKTSQAHERFADLQE